MGVKLLDEFSYLHFASGIIAYYWGIPLWLFVIIHIIFELFENTQFGMNVINKVSMWPGGKEKADTYTNMLGDTLIAALGWMSVVFLLDVVNGRNSSGRGS